MYKVSIDKFEGPFDLLVYLLENAKMDIYDIRVGEITEQYIGYLREMDERSFEVDTEFIVLAAVLIRLKSHMLLPRMSASDEIMIAEDPREELRTRLIEYVRTRKLAELLAEREELNLLVHEKPAEDMSEYLDNPEEMLYATEEQMVNAFILFLTRKKKVEDVSRRYQKVRSREETLEARIEYMVSRLEAKLGDPDSGAGVSFLELLPEKPDRYDVTLSFVSLLSLMRNQGFDAEQRENFGEIIVKRKESASLLEDKAESDGEMEALDV